MENIKGKLDKEIFKYIKSDIEPDTMYVKESNSVYNNFFSDPIRIIQVIRQGVTYRLFNYIKEYSPFKETEWAELIGISAKSLQRYKQASSRFNSAHSEKILEIAEIINSGIEVFGDMEKLSSWLNTPNFALGSYKPKDLIGDSYGKEMVLNELTRINYGILA